MQAELKHIMKKDPKAKYRLRYVDYSEGTWTAPLQLTDIRINKFVSDKSVEKVEVTLSNGNRLVLVNR